MSEKMNEEKFEKTEAGMPAAEAYADEAGQAQSEVEADVENSSAEADETAKSQSLEVNDPGQAGDAAEAGEMGEESAEAENELDEAADEEIDEEAEIDEESDDADEIGEAKKSIGDSFKTKNFRLGMKSSVITAVVVVGVILINLLAGHLPGSLNSIDISSRDIYSTGSQTAELLDSLDQDITIRVLAAKDSSDENINLLLENYKKGSKHISVEYVDMNTDLAASDQYSSYTANSIVVTSDSREVVADYNDIYQYDYSDYYTSGSVSSSFDGEGQITSAIYKVTAESMPVIYTLTGHGETALGSSALSMVSKQNMMTEDISLMGQDIPEDCAALVINGPAVDLAAEEAAKIRDYLAGGGSVMVLLSYTESKLENLEAIMNENGISSVDGIVMETSGNCFNYQINVLADIPMTDITSDLAKESANILMTYARGLTIGECEGRTLTELLASSNGAYSKIPVGGQLATLEKEAGDIEGPFSFAVMSENEADGGKLIAISSDTLIDDSILQYPVGNLDLFMNCLTYMSGDDSAVSVSIEPKSMDIEYMTIPALHGMIWMFVSIILIPLAIFVTGLVIWLIRRKK